jgi:hypothetical protein
VAAVQATPVMLDGDACVGPAVKRMREAAAGARVIGEIVAGPLYGGAGMLIHDGGRPLRPRGRPPPRAGNAAGERHGAVTPDPAPQPAR